MVSKKKLSMMSRLAKEVRARASQGDTKGLHIGDVIEMFGISYDTARKLMYETTFFFKDLEYENGYLRVRSEFLEKEE